MGHGQRRGWKGAARTAQAFFVRQLGAQGGQQRHAHQERPGGRQKGRERSGGTRCRVRIRRGEEERAVISLSSVQQAKVTSQAKVKSQTHLQAESAQQSSRKKERERERVTTEIRKPLAVASSSTLSPFSTRAPPREAHRASEASPLAYPPVPLQRALLADDAEQRRNLHSNGLPPPPACLCFLL